MKHICNPTAGFRRGKANLLMYLQWYIQGRLKPMQPMQPHWAPRRGGARGVPGGQLPPKILPGPPVAPSRFFRSSSESPTQTIDSSPCCKTGPSSGPPNENVWLRPWPRASRAPRYGVWVDCSFLPDTPCA